MALTEHAWKAFVQYDPLDYRLEAEAYGPPVLTYWNEEKLGPPPTEQQIADAIAAYDAARATETADKARARNAARSAAASAVGKQFSALSQAERTGVLMVLVNLLGGLNPNGTVRPFDEWGT